MANLDKNYWYRFTIGGGFLVGTDLGHESGTGSAYWRSKLDETDDSQVWQFFPFNETYYVLRTKANPLGYLNAKIEYNTSFVPEGVVGQTVTYMANSSLSDDSMFWTINPREDGMFYLTNAENGTNWHLDSSGWAWMNSNITLRQFYQGFSFKQQGKIDDEQYSRVVLPNAMATVAPTNTGTTSATMAPTGFLGTTTSATMTPTALLGTITPKPESTATAVKKSGLSTGAKGGIGAAVGVVALIALITIGFLLYRKRKRGTRVERTGVDVMEELKGPKEVEYLVSTAHETERKKRALSHELHSQTQYEMEVPPAELESSEMRWEMRADSNGRS